MSGVTVVHGNIAYFSTGYNVYSYLLLQNKWTEPTPCEYEEFGMAILKDKLTTIGGQNNVSGTTKSILCLSKSVSKMKWEKLLPPMLTNRIWPAAQTTSSHLVVAGGRTEQFGDILLTVEVLDLNTLRWSFASSSPKALKYPKMTLCDKYFYLSEHNTILSCSVEELLKSCKPASTDSSDVDSVWTRLTDIPLAYT